MSKDCFKADPNDFIIVVMGPTGSGKSNFINTLTWHAEQHGADSLKLATQSVTPYTIEYHDHRFVLVDTPGFDDASRPDAEVIMNVADWLKQKYADGATLKVAGIIYLHRITDNRMSGSVYKNLQMFGRLCGSIPLHRARLVTTMWDKARDRAVADNRETQLTGDFWRKLIDEGAVARRFDNTHTCAWDIVREVIDLGKDGEADKQNCQNGLDADTPAHRFCGLFPTKRN